MCWSMQKWQKVCPQPVSTRGTLSSLPREWYSLLHEEQFKQFIFEFKNWETRLLLMKYQHYYDQHH